MPILQPAPNRASSRLDPHPLAHQPLRPADPALCRKVRPREHLQGSALLERRGATPGHIPLIALDHPAAAIRSTAPAAPYQRKKARHSPIRQLRHRFSIGAGIPDPGQVARGSELPPPHARRPIIDQDRLRPPRRHQRQFLHPVRLGRHAPTRAFGVKSHAPTATPNPVVPPNPDRTCDPMHRRPPPARQTRKGRSHRITAANCREAASAMPTPDGAKMWACARA